MQPIIVGVDVGHNSAFAALDLSGKIVGTFSCRGLPHAYFKKEILKLGKPMLIAVDRKNPPQFPKKLAASFGCRIFSPENDLPLSEKKRVYRKFSDSKIISNMHERDALAAALSARKSLAASFAKISNYASEAGLENFSDDIMEIIFTKTAKNFSEASVLLKERIKD